MIKVFIDGASGTTGLRIAERLSQRKDIELLSAEGRDKKDPGVRSELINSADAAILCLPDDAARESAALCTNDRTVIIDASTAHRTAPGWAYGMPELGKEYREAVRTNRRIASPGCHASGAIALLRPLTDAGILPADYPLFIVSLTGYSGGGKSMIAEYESAERSSALSSPRGYSIDKSHKHIPEIVKYTGILSAPAFLPVVADYYSGMLTFIALAKEQLSGDVTALRIRDCYGEFYRNARFIISLDDGTALFDRGFMASNGMSGKDSMKVCAFDQGEQIILTALFDNLGKGASGAAIQCLNIAAGADEGEGLVL